MYLWYYDLINVYKSFVQSSRNAHSFFVEDFQSDALYWLINLTMGNSVHFQSEASDSYEADKANSNQTYAE